MNVTLPIYIEEHSREAGEMPIFHVCPLHDSLPSRRSEKLSRALAQLHTDLHDKLMGLSRKTRHDELAQWCHLPNYDSTTLELRIDLKSGSYLRRFFLAGYEALGRKLWFTPKLPDVHFEVLKDQRLVERATEVFTQHFREVEKKGDVVDFDAHALPLRGRASLTALEVTIKPAQNAGEPKPTDLASIFGQARPVPNGEEELRKVGQLLNALHPDDLPRAVGRDAEVADLERLLRLPDRRAILLVGPRQVGKTAIIHEMTWRMMEDKEPRRRRNIWLVSPMRLISGMSLVGEWQQRVQAICNHIERKDAVLYFDDLLGLFTAGKSAHSDLNVAQLLKPRMEQRSMRVLAEITPESWRVLREKDRSLAEMFHVVPVVEPGEADTLRTLISVARTLERQHQCEFALEVVPTTYELYRRFASDAAFPGKAAGFMQRLAVKHAGSQCHRGGVLNEFHERTGLQIAMIDSTQALDRRTILTALGEHVSGQDEVLHAFADVLLKLKARLNDPRRPLAAFLLLGPTGVGKTQCAKALAEHLFGSPERMLRFNMNEMVDATAVPRLTGTPAQPDGLLTGAVRRQPFSVILFDEIEKAAPEVFDMLLGVLDEGRLSDALGRVADFTSSVILLTSNLGVRDAGARIDFRSRPEKETETAYISAAEKFFRPEFFNRLDRVIPFRELNRDHLATIARRLLGDVLKRDGLRQRQCLFAFTEAAADRLVELGYHPQLGARALKRVIEREVAQPLAAALAERAPGVPLRIELQYTSGQFALFIHELHPMERTIFWPERLSRGEVDAADVVDAAYDALDRLSAVVEQYAPRGKVELGSLTPALERYYHCREQIMRVERLLRAAEASLKAKPAPAGRAVSVTRARPVKVVIRQFRSGTSNPIFDRARDAEQLESNLADISDSDHEIVETPVFATVRELALLELMAAGQMDDEPLALIIHGEGIDPYFTASAVQTTLFQLLANHWGTEAKVTKDSGDFFGPFRSGIWTVGIQVARLLQAVLGGWLIHGGNGSLDHLEVTILPCPTETAMDQLMKQRIPRSDAPIVMSVRPDDQIISHRTGLVIPLKSDSDAYRAFHLSELPLPEELNRVFHT